MRSSSRFACHTFSIAIVAASVGPTARASTHDFNTSIGDWSVASNWMQPEVPDHLSCVRVGWLVPSALLTVDGDQDVHWLNVINESNVQIADPTSRLRLTTDTTVEPGSTLLVAGELDCGNQDGGLTMRGSSLFLQDGFVSTRWMEDPDLPGLVQGSGTIELWGNSYSGSWQGVIQPLGTLSLIEDFTPEAAPFDLDGTGAADGSCLIDATTPNCELLVELTGADPFSGTINVGPDAFVDIPLVDVDSNVHLMGNSSQSANVRTGDLLPGAHVRSHSGITRLQCGQVFDGANIDVDLESRMDVSINNLVGPITSVDGQLRLYGASGFRNDVSGTGRLTSHPSSILFIFDEVTLDLPIVELGDTVVDEGQSLTVNADKLTQVDPDVQGYDGFLENFGSVTINTTNPATGVPVPWRLDGEIVFGLTPLTTELQGSTVVITDTGVVRMTGPSSRITAPVFVEPGGTIDVELGVGVHEQDGDLTFFGGEIIGPGHFIQVGDSTIAGPTTISPGLFDWDGLGTPSTTLVNFQGDLTIDTRIAGFSGVHDAHSGTVSVYGLLDVTNRDSQGNAIPWHSDGSVVLHGGSNLGGSGLSVDNGLLDVRVGALINESIVTSPVFINGTGAINLNDGTDLNMQNLLVLNGDGGAPEVTGSLGRLFMNGDLTVLSDATINCRLFDWDGNAPNTTTIGQFAHLTVDVEFFEIFFFQTVSTDVFMHPFSQLTVLRPDNEPWTYAGNMYLPQTATLHGAPMILGSAGTIRGDGALDTDITNRGTVEPLNGQLALTALRDYVQDATGTFRVEIDEQHTEHLYGSASSTFNLAGRLEVTLEEGFVPKMYEPFTIMTAGTITGTFDDVDAPGFELNYLDGPTADTVFVLFVGLPCPADANGDTEVSFGDLLTIIAAWGPCGDPCPADVNEDGVVDFGDILNVISNWGACP